MFKKNQKNTQSLFSSREHQQAVEVLEAFIQRSHHRRSHCSVLGCFSVNSCCWVLSPFQKEEVSLVKIILSARVRWNNQEAKLE